MERYGNVSSVGFKCNLMGGVNVGWDCAAV